MVFFNPYIKDSPCPYEPPREFVGYPMLHVEDTRHKVRHAKKGLGYSGLGSLENPYIQS